MTEVQTIHKRRLDPPAAFAEQMPDHEFWMVEFGDDEYSVICGREAVDPAQIDVRWHISVAGHDAVPPWEALAAIVHSVRPGVPFVLGVPPASWWINIHRHTLHLWEFHDSNLLGQWRFERRGDRRT